MYVSAARDEDGAVSPSPKGGTKKPTSLSRDIYNKPIITSPHMPCMHLPQHALTGVLLRVVYLGPDP